ncbi:type II toxin-antitoxin system CcdA family antitoxin [Enterococcus mundtii]|uniref:type II toxin-antitoxin system CcdA family antitoxin n=1 Tax=Enterococcus mundtii TaxID=53346 RepID=UPI000E0632B0|nr:type II toxin-antitoxin system CcdA family antitoxin [Enterococcus mundtii]STE38118.1 Uncharacterised protein [Enterococcus mundtii]
MSKEAIVYPAVFEYEATEGYENYINVYFPDVPSADTYGVGLKEATYNAWESLGLNLYDREQDKLPKSSNFEDVQKKFPNAIIQYVSVDLDEYAKGVTKVVPKVKKNTNIPKDLAAEAESLGINFSSVLTKALYKEVDEIKHHQKAMHHA